MNEETKDLLNALLNYRIQSERDMGEKEIVEYLKTVREKQDEEEMFDSVKMCAWDIWDNGAGLTPEEKIILDELTEKYS